MQLDRTEIVIRQRSVLELFDLSLLVLRRHLRPLLLCSALLGLPLMLANIAITAWMLSEETQLISEGLGDPLAWLRFRHAVHLAILTWTQFPLVSLPATIYLGNRIFFEPMSIGELSRRLLPILGRVIIVLGIMRLGLLILAFELLVNHSVPFDWVVESWLIFTLGVVALFIRALWPFAPEILGLERCRLRAAAKREITYGQRSKGLHGSMMGDHFARFLSASGFAILLSMMMLGTLLFLQGTIRGSWQWNLWFDHLWFPLTVWLVGIYLSVFRFLSYLDTRIRLEGWELDLKLRAEADRLTSDEHVSAGENEFLRQAKDSTLPSNVAQPEVSR